MRREPSVRRRVVVTELDRFLLLALETGWLPPTLNLDHPDPACALDHVAHEPRRTEPRVALSNSFGFGCTNAALVLERWEG